MFGCVDGSVAVLSENSDYRVHGTQNDRLEPRVSMQKLVLKNMQRVPRYWLKHPKLCRFGLATLFLARFA